MSSQNIRSGDVIFVLRGCDVPVILRPTGSQFVFISGCYVEGLMDGQARDWLEQGKAEEQELDII